MATNPVDDDLAKLQADEATVDADVAQLAKDRAAEEQVQPQGDPPIIFGTTPVLWNAIFWVRI